jgi:hypothetical protein
LCNRNGAKDGSCNRKIDQSGGIISEISRRDFVKTTATAAAAGLVLATALDLHASALGLPIGCQTWPVRDMIAKDFSGTIKTLVQAGFQTVELCSPVATPILDSPVLPFQCQA